MKKIVFVLATLIFFTGLQVKSQVASVVNYSSLERKLENSNGDIQHDRRKERVGSWTDRAELLVDIFNVHNDVLYIGMGTSEANLLMQQPNEIQASQDGPNQIEEYIYDRVTLTFENGELSSWTETNPIMANPLEEAKAAIDEAIRLNVDGDDDKAIIDAIAALQSAYEINAVLEYEAGNLEGSYNNFAAILNMYDLPVMSEVETDTLIIYNTGRTAVESENFSEGVRLLSQLDEMDYNEPFMYIYLKQSLFGVGDTAAGVEIINKGFNKYPENQSLLNELINYYITTQQADQALELLNVAKERDPENVSYSFAEAVMYETIGDLEEAERVYLECLEMDPDFFDAAYNMGVLFWNKAVKIYEEASMTTDNAVYQQLDSQGDEMLMKSIPYMEKAHEIDPNDTYTLDNLRNIYYRLEMTNEYNEVVKKLESL